MTIKTLAASLCSGIAFSIVCPDPLRAGFAGGFMTAAIILFIDDLRS